jgi:hypothetical protein
MESILCVWINLHAMILDRSAGTFGEALDCKVHRTHEKEQVLIPLTNLWRQFDTAPIHMLAKFLSLLAKWLKPTWWFQPAIMRKTNGALLKLLSW